MNGIPSATPTAVIRAAEADRPDAPPPDPARGAVVDELSGAEAGLRSAVEQAIHRLPLSGLMVERSLSGADGAVMPYRLHLPPGLDAAHPLPVVLYLHSAGQRGAERLLRNAEGFTDLGIGVFVLNQPRHPCIVIAPQILPGIWAERIGWSDPRSDMAPEMNRNLALALAILDRVVATHPVDRERIYITGTSMGGCGVYEAIVRRPRCFAAGLVICGAHDDRQGAALAGTPLWICHGTLDTCITVERSRQLVDAIRAAGGTRVTYTEYRRLHHSDCSDLVYADPAVLEWLFSQRRSDPMAG